MTAQILSLPSRKPLVLSLMAAEVREMEVQAGYLPGQWLVATELNDNGGCYAGLIALDRDASAFAFTVERRAGGIGVMRASGEVVTKACASVGEAMGAIRRAILDRH